MVAMVSRITAMVSRIVMMISRITGMVNRIVKIINITAGMAKTQETGGLQTCNHHRTHSHTGRTSFKQEVVFILPTNKKVFFEVSAQLF